MAAPRQLIVVGLSHKTAPIEVRERMAFAAELLPAALKEATALAGVGEVMIVSTCNRVELYAGVDLPEAGAALRHFLVAGRTLPEEFAAHLYACDGDAALRHLFRVAASLDSMVVGESQILGQVKDAYTAAVEAGTVGPLLQRAVPRAFQVAKRVRTDTDVAKSPASIASAAVDLAAQIFGDLGGRKVLVVGAGKMGELSARHLQSAQIGELWVVNRTLARATQLAEKLQGRAADWERLDELLQRVDIVLCSTGAREPVIRRAQVERAMRLRRGRWLFFVDIAVPRDVEPEVGSLENVYLYDVDALEEVVSQHRAQRAGQAGHAEALVERELLHYRAQERTLGAVPTIKRLRERFLEVGRLEIERTLPRLGALGDRDRAAVEAMVQALVNKLLHQPLTRLKEEAREGGSELTAAVQELFGLAAQAGDEGAAPLAQRDDPESSQASKGRR